MTLLYESFAPVALAVDLAVDPTPDGLEVIFEDGLTVEGIALARGDAPLASVQLVWTPDAAPLGERMDCATDSSGQFRVSGLSAGNHRVQVLPGFHAYAERPVVCAVGNGSIRDAVLSFDIPLPIAVNVTDETGAGIGGVRFGYRYDSPRTSAMGGTAETDPLGRTSVGALPGTGNLTLNASHPELGRARTTIDLADAPPRIALVLGTFSPSNVIGRVLTADGEATRRSGSYGRATRAGHDRRDRRGTPWQRTFS